MTISVGSRLATPKLTDTGYSTRVKAKSALSRFLFRWASRSMLDTCGIKGADLERNMSLLCPPGAWLVKKIRPTVRINEYMANKNEGLTLSRIGPSTESGFYASGYGPQCIVVDRRGGGTKAVENAAPVIRRVCLHWLRIGILDRSA